MHNRTLLERVLLTCDTVTDTWRQCLALGKELARMKLDVVLASMGPAPSPEQRLAVRQLERVTLIESTYRLEWMREAWPDVDRAGEWLLRVSQEFEVDLVHLNQFSFGSLPWKCPCIITAHTCVWSWLESIGVTPGPQWLEYKRRVKAGLRAARAVTAPSHAILQSLLRHYGSFPAADPIPDGIDTSSYRPRNKKHFILSVGRIWDEAKNFAVLDRAAGDVPWPVVAIGDTAHPEGGVGSFRFLKVPGTLPTRQVRQWMGHAPIFVLPALYDPFGYPILEAGSSGCALILGDIPHLREIWNDAATFVDPTDPGSVSRALLDLIHDPDLRAKRSAQAMRRARQFPPSLTAQRYLQLYLGLTTAGGISNSRESYTIVSPSRWQGEAFVNR